MAHRYVREMFLNLILSEEIIPFCGFHVTNFHTEEEWEKDISWGW